VAQRDRRGARRERLVHVHEVERRERQHLLHRARDVDRRRRPAAPLQRQKLADREHAHAAVGVEERVGVLARRPDQPARVAHQRGRARRGQHEQPVPACRELVRQLTGERVDLVVVLPGVGSDLGDREPLRHLGAA
jgi:hypothetical protein